MDVLDWIKKAGDLALNARNVELQSAIVEIKRDVLELKEENLKLRERNSELERRKARPLVYRAPSYFETKEDGTEDGPFCQKCYDVDGKLVRQHDTREETGLWRKCLQCKFGLWVERWPGPPKQPRESSWIRARRGY